MSRTTDPSTREEILGKVISAMSKNGLNNLSLRDLAKEIDVSARMLIYYFESYDALINELFIHLSLRHKAILKKLLLEKKGKPFAEVLQSFIETMYSPENKKTLLLFMELYTKALRNTGEHTSFFNEVLYNWISEVETMIAPKYGNNSKVYATMIMSFYRGLMLDWLASKDVERIYEANKAFTALIAGLMNGKR